MQAVQKYCRNCSTLMVVGFLLLTFDTGANLFDVVGSFFSSGYYFLLVGKGGNTKQANGNECSQYESTPVFSSNLPICPVYFHLVVPRHILSHEHTLGV
jgi:hypothetical protein